MADNHWLCDEPYANNPERLERFLKRFNPDALLQRASSLNGDQSCVFSEKYSLGNFNYVRKISFSNGTAWVARVRMPPWQEEEDKFFRAYAFGYLKAEVAAMELVRKHTDIPVPKVYYTAEGFDGDVGFPYLLMEYVDANTAWEVIQRYHAAMGCVPEQLEHNFWRQMAGVMVKLASVRAPMIGTVLEGSTASVMLIGPFPESQSGPYISSRDYYDHYPLALAQQLPRNPVTRGQDRFIETFREFARNSFSDGEVTFGLKHQDLATYNVLVDDELNIQAVIDWDGLIALPRAALHYYPKFMGMGLIHAGSTVDETRPKIQRAFGFARTVEEVARLHAEGNHPLFTAAEFCSGESLSNTVLEGVKFEHEYVNLVGIRVLEWMEGHPDERIRASFMC